jgi:hypothetical protein
MHLGGEVVRVRPFVAASDLVKKVPPSLELTSITVAAPAPRMLAKFYPALLGGENTALDPARQAEPESAGWAQVRTPRLTLNFEFEQRWQAPHWPAEADRQSAIQHLDIRVDDLASASHWAVACGAQIAEYQPQDDVRVMFDPTGHPFCLFC